MLVRRILVAGALASAALIPAGTSYATHNDCHNEPGDIWLVVAGVDTPGGNGYYFACIGDGNYGVHVSGTCVELIINSEQIGGC